MPGLKKSLVDPVPEVRGMSARALGAMVRGIGEQGFEDLQPWLMETLTSDGNTVNRYISPLFLILFSQNGKAPPC